MLNICLCHVVNVEIEIAFRGPTLPSAFVLHSACVSDLVLRQEFSSSNGSCSRLVLHSHRSCCFEPFRFIVGFCCGPFSAELTQT